MAGTLLDNVVDVREAALIGDLKVKRALPIHGGRMVGPFAFLDELGPVTLAPGTAGDVPPHPHIGLSTVTYLYSGALLHRDTLGSKQLIVPGDVNWMTAGRGIAHSERVTPETRAERTALHGVQIWVALPVEAEQTAPEFTHYERSALPRFEAGRAAVVLIAGRAFGRVSPVKTHSPLFLLDARIPAGETLAFETGAGFECALYLMSGAVKVDGETFPAPRLLVFKAGAPLQLEARDDTHGLCLGGTPFPERRHIWWNFVSSSRDRIESAKRDWREERLPPIAGETERVPLPA